MDESRYRGGAAEGLPLLPDRHAENDARRLFYALDVRFTGGSLQCVDTETIALSPDI